MGRAFLSQSPTNFHQPLGNTIRRMSRQRFITITYLDISDVVLETRPGLDAEFYGLGLGHGLRPILPWPWRYDPQLVKRSSEWVSEYNNKLITIYMELILINEYLSKSNQNVFYYSLCQTYCVAYPNFCSGRRLCIKASASGPIALALASKVQALASALSVEALVLRFWRWLHHCWTSVTR